VAQESSRTSLRRAFRVRVALDRLDAVRMRPGLSSRVIIHTMAQQNALIVPRASIDFSSAKPRVHLVSGKVVEVVLGACNAQECVVKNGLNEGETLGRVVASVSEMRETPLSYRAALAPRERGEGDTQRSGVRVRGVATRVSALATTPSSAFGTFSPVRGGEGLSMERRYA